MKKAILLSVFFACSFFLLIFIGCSVPKEDGIDGNREKGYAETINERIVSFADCADGFSDSLEKIAESKSAPSDKQIAEMEQCLAKLEAVCEGLTGQKATGEYADAQKKLDDAMSDYGEAFAKCRALLDFFKHYDEQFRKSGDPVKESKEMEKRERALYGEFANAMLQAADSFRAACDEFEAVVSR